MPCQSRSNCLIHLLASLLAASALCSCKVGPNYERPDLPVPDTWAEIRIDAEPEATPDWDSWWSVFNDPILNDLIVEADANNKNLLIAVARIDEYRARYGIASADLYPDVQAFTAYRRNRVSDTDFDQPGYSVGGPFNNWGIGMDASWEIDLFGRIARSIEAASAEWEGMIEDWRNVMVTLRADVAASYVNIRTLQGRRRVVLENLKSSRKLIKLTSSMEHSGTSSKLQVYQATAQQQQFEAQLPRIDMQLAKEINNLAVLLGRNQGDLAQQIGDGYDIPMPPGEVSVGIPADIIRRRPDLRSAERSLAAATARIGVAEAMLYPRLQLMGTFAFAASNFSDVWNWSSRTYSAGPAISWDFFNGGRLRSAVKESEAITKQALLNYEQTALVAIAEVETALAGFALSARERDILMVGVEAGREALRLATLQYSSGTLDFITLLTAQQQILTLEDELVQAKGLSAETLVELYRALGGGWTPQQLPPSFDEDAKEPPDMTAQGKDSA
ncbi:MAG: efflux transporter outer membrane subunit [Planctomycetota bacterium]|nr:efflux transporter outer membrane subunit [Planctomycetota bacterium]